MDKEPSIEIRGLQVHNLKNLSLKIPKNKLVVVTGPSGSGKSSLAFDTIYAEGQRRYVESLSTYARQFLDQLPKPKLDFISGLSPTISIEQKSSSFNPRSTVGTVTEVYDYLRVLFARISEPYCYQCGKKIDSQTSQQIVDHILTFEEGTKISILSPLAQGKKGEFQKELQQLRLKGFVRAKIDGEIYELDQEIQLEKNKKHDIDVYIDRIIIKNKNPDFSSRVSDSVDLALQIGQGQLKLELIDSKQEILISKDFACTHCGISYPPPEPRTFSFNSPLGACPTCNGLGTEETDFTLEEDESDLPSEVQLYRKEEKPCPDCKGARLRIESLSYKISKKNISELTSFSISNLIQFFDSLKLEPRKKLISERLLLEILERLNFLKKLGLHYLTLSRSARSLSGGESQRIRLAAQLGSSLVGVTYVLDEPSIGLHQRDNDQLLDTLKSLRDLGNTVLVVEHDEDTMKSSDWILDLGPGAGTLGGELIAQGSYSEVLKNKKSVTGQYLSGKKSIPISIQKRSTDPKKLIHLDGATKNNLKNISLDLPLGHFIFVTGVSGSGKSTLIMDTLYPALLQKLYPKTKLDPQIKKLSGVEHIKKVVDIDQKPIGRTPRSNPATYIGVFSTIRDLFASLPDSKIRGFTPGHFSFNVKGGRCEVCEGAGLKKVEMHFLPDVFVHCNACNGTRYQKEVLSIRYKGLNISEVLHLNAKDAYDFFESIPSLKNKLKLLNDVGLGYITLGQSATTLSGGEAQRIKLTKELSRKGHGDAIYILDEPSTGLHFDDIAKLLFILQELVALGNTVIVIEHNLDMIKCADTVIDMGPEAGEEGGEIVFMGSPEDLIKNKKSITGKYLKPYFK